MHIVCGAQGSGGGALGAILATPLVNLLGKVGAIILCIGAVILLAVFTFGINMSEIINNMVEKNGGHHYGLYVNKDGRVKK